MFRCISGCNYPDFNFVSVLTDRIDSILSLEGNEERIGRDAYALEKENRFHTKV